jgi:hypothetical protein
MNAIARQRIESGLSASAQSNEFDRKRIERALQRRKRYRYVAPTVHMVDGGYRIESPCCSRNIDPDGGIVDVALLQYEAGATPWRLYSKQHRTHQWTLHGLYERLDDLLEQLNADPQRLFWQ